MSGANTARNGFRPQPGARRPMPSRQLSKYASSSLERVRLALEILGPASNLLAIAGVGLGLVTSLLLPGSPIGGKGFEMSSSSSPGARLRPAASDLQGVLIW